MPGSADRQRSIRSINWPGCLNTPIRLPLLNYRIGLDALIGFIPGLGDMAGHALVELYRVASRAVRGITPVLMRMVFNIGIEAAIGMVLVLGDIFDATFKANVRNVQLLSGMSWGTRQPDAQADGEQGDRGHRRRLTGDSGVD